MARNTDVPCFECGAPALHKHHIIPVVLGGSAVVDLCETCHSLIHGADLRISALVKEGMRKARERGIKLGRPANKASPDIYSFLKCFPEMSYSEIGRKLKVHHSVVSRIARSMGMRKKKL